MALELLAISPVGSSGRAQSLYGLTRDLELVIRSGTLQREVTVLFTFCAHGTQRDVYESRGMSLVLKLHPMQCTSLDAELALCPHIQPWVLPLLWEGHFMMWGAMYRVALQPRATFSAEGALRCFLGTTSRVTQAAVEGLVGYLCVLLQGVLGSAAAGVMLSGVTLDCWGFVGTVHEQAFGGFELGLLKWDNCQLVQDLGVPRKEVNESLRKLLAGVCAACRPIQALIVKEANNSSDNICSLAAWAAFETHH